MARPPPRETEAGRQTGTAGLLFLVLIGAWCGLLVGAVVCRETSVVPKAGCAAPRVSAMQGVQHP